MEPGLGSRVWPTHLPSREGQDRVITDNPGSAGVERTLHRSDRSSAGFLPTSQQETTKVTHPARDTSPGKPQQPRTN